MKTILFTAENCAPCKSVKKQLDRAAVEYTVIERETPQGIAFMSKYFMGATGIPIIMLLDNSENPVKSFIGTSAAADYLRFI